MPPQQQGAGATISDSGAANTGAATDEVSTVRPVSLRQGRGARLSFLGGLKKDHSTPQQQQQQQYSPPPPVPQINGNHLANGHHNTANGDGHDANANHNRTLAKDNPNRRSFFRSHSGDQQKQQGVVVHVNDTGGGGGEWANSESEKAGAEDHGASKVGNVRRRLSMLKLGKKSSKGNGLMGSLEEE